MSEPTEIPEKIKFDYLKSQFHREIFVEGAHGGITPRGYIQMSVFSERRPIPRQTVFPLEKSGRLGEEISSERESRDSIIRSVEASLLMDILTAKSIVTWLAKQIEVAEGLAKIGQSSKSIKVN